MEALSIRRSFPAPCADAGITALHSEQLFNVSQ